MFQAELKRQLSVGQFEVPENCVGLESIVAAQFRNTMKKLILIDQTYLVSYFNPLLYVISLDFVFHTVLIQADRDFFHLAESNLLLIALSHFKFQRITAKFYDFLARSLSLMRKINKQFNFSPYSI